MNGKRLFSSIAVATLLSWALAATASAQTAASPASTTNEGAGLQEVIVTARHERENLQVVPISITAISGEDIREKNITAPDDFNTTVPGLTVALTSLDRASVTYTVRGQGQILGGPDASVATYFNDVPTVVTSSGFLFDLENLEVLKGPQGTLFGVNSTGGAILFVPQRPTNNFGGYVDATVGNYNAQRYQAVLNVPLISDVLLVRFAADLNYRDGYTRGINGHQYDDTDYQAARLGVMFRPSDRFENYFLVNVATLNEHGAGNECLIYNPQGNFIQFAGNEAAACAAQQAYGPRLVNMWIPPLGDYVRTRNYAADDTITIRLTDDITLKNILAYREYLYKQSYTNFGTPFPVFEYSLDPHWSAGLGVAAPSQRKYSDEIQLHGDSLQHRLHWQSGLYFDTLSPHSRDDVDVGVLFNYVAVFKFQSLNWKKRHAVYGQATYNLTDKLSFTAGARYTEDLRRQLTTPLNTFGNTDLSAKFHGTTWNVSLQYQLNPGTMLYAASRRGYKSGGFNNVSLQAAQEYGTEFVTDGELGAKTEFHFGDVKGRINAAVFYGKFTGWQERVTKFFDTPSGRFPFAVVANVAEGVDEGAEFEATIIPTPHLEISAFYTYLNPYFTFNSVDGNDYSHTPIAETVKHKTSATVRYLFGLPSTVGDVSVSATYAWQSSQTGVLNIDAAARGDPNHGELPAFGVLNMRADWRGVLGHPLDLSAFVDNATDKTYLSVMNNFWIGGEDIGQYAPPRMWGVSARWHF